MTPVSNIMTSSFGTALRNNLLTKSNRGRSGFCGSDRIAICCRRLKFQSCRKTVVCNYVGRNGGVVFLALGDVSSRPSERGGNCAVSRQTFLCHSHSQRWLTAAAWCMRRWMKPARWRGPLSGFRFWGWGFSFQWVLFFFLPLRALRPTGEFLGAFEKLRKSEC